MNPLANYKTLFKFVFPHKLDFLKLGDTYFSKEKSTNFGCVGHHPEKYGMVHMLSSLKNKHDVHRNDVIKIQQNLLTAHRLKQIRILGNLEVLFKN